MTRTILLTSATLILFAGCKKYSADECLIVAKASMEHQDEFHDCISAMAFAEDEVERSKKFAEEMASEPGMEKYVLEDFASTEKKLDSAEDKCAQWAENVRESARRLGLDNEELLAEIRVRRDGEVWSSVVPECVDE